MTNYTIINIKDWIMIIRKIEEKFFKISKRIYFYATMCFTRVVTFVCTPFKTWFQSYPHTSLWV